MSELEPTTEERPRADAIEYLVQPPAGWFVLDVMPASGRKRRDWTALLISVHPNELKNFTCEFPALFYVHPDDYKPGARRACQGWFRIPGKHKTREAAWHALEAMMATRH